MGDPIISVSGLRGIIGAELTPMVASRYIAAYCTELPKGTVVISRDGRESGGMLASAVSATLEAHGQSVLDLGIAATPTVGVEVRNHQAVAGIQISASHNPREYNGLKLFNADGRVLPAEHGRRVLDAYRRSAQAWCTIEKLGSVERIDDPHASHLELVSRIVDGAKIAAKKFRVYLESNHGAGCLLGKRLLQSLGCEVTLSGGTPDGRFEHPPEPLAENLEVTCQSVRAGNYDIAFCQDPDADRLAVIDEKGIYIGEESTVALCMKEVFADRHGPVVINCATSSMSLVIARENNSPAFLSAVGEANVVDKMLAEKAIFGGEGNGGPIDPRVGLVRDSFVGMALILGLMTRTGRTVSELASGLPKFGMVKNKMQWPPERLRASMDAVSHAIQDATVSTQDGVRWDWPDRWILLRGSNTEPIVRLIAEAPTSKEAEELVARISQLMQKTS